MIKKYVTEKFKGLKYGDRPYIVHLEETASICEEFNGEPIHQSLALLHDILEEPTGVSLFELSKNFGIKLAWKTYLISDEAGKNRTEKKAKTYPKIKSDLDVTFVKCADRIANGRNCIKDNPQLLKMYKKEYPEFKEQLWNEKFTRLTSIGIDLKLIEMFQVMDKMFL